MKSIIFIIGTGRSGTHLVANILASNPNINITIEKQPIFRISTKIALYQDMKLLPRLVSLYKKEIATSLFKHYADKSHPNIWIAEKLKNVFPNAIFVGTNRDPYATVSSMLKHAGVLRWIRNWREYPLPNPFLGITDAKGYELLTLEQKCTLRWLSHTKRINELKNKLGNDLHIVEFDKLLLNPEKEINDIKQFLKIDGDFNFTNISKEPLYKWKKHLTDI